MSETPQPPAKPQIRITCWIDEDILMRFHALYPRHGAVTAFVRAAITKRVEGTEKTAKELLQNG